MADNTLNMLIGAFVCLVIGLALVSVVAEQTNTVTSTQKFAGNLTGPDIPRWGGDNNVLDNSSGYIYLSDTGLDQAISLNADLGCGGIANYATIHLYNGTSANLGTDLGVSGQGNWTIHCSTTPGQTYINFENSTYMVNSIIGNTSVTNFVEVYPMSYLAQGWSRSILSMVAGFFALGLLACSVGLFYGVARNFGLL